MEAVVTDFGVVDVLVNCAGIFRSVPLPEASPEDWASSFDINVRAAYFLIQAAVPHMLAKGRGSIVNVTSICSPFGLPGTAIYSATKGALASLTRALMSDLARQGININAVAPGNIATALNIHLREIPGYIEKWTELTPCGVAFPEPDVIADAIAFLASDEAKNIHGQEIVVDGGVSIALSPAAISLNS